MAGMDADQARYHRRGIRQGDELRRILAKHATFYRKLAERLWELGFLSDDDNHHAYCVTLEVRAAVNHLRSLAERAGIPPSIDIRDRYAPRDPDDPEWWLGADI